MNPSYWDHYQFRNFMRFFIIGFFVMFWYFHEQLNWIMNWNRVNNMGRALNQTQYETRLAYTSWMEYVGRAGNMSGAWSMANPKVEAATAGNYRDGGTLINGDSPMFIEIALRNRNAAHQNQATAH